MWVPSPTTGATSGEPPRRASAIDRASGVKLGVPTQTAPSMRASMSAASRNAAWPPYAPSDSPPSSSRGLVAAGRRDSSASTLVSSARPAAAGVRRSDSSATGLGR